MCKDRIRTSFSAVEIAMAIVLLAVALLPILSSLSGGRKGTVHAENKFVGEQYALEISEWLDVLTLKEARKFTKDLNANKTSSPYVSALSSPGNKKFACSVKAVDLPVKDDVGDAIKKINFTAFTITVKIPAIKAGETRFFKLTKLVRERITASK
ncbi:hypothetical protein ACFL35_13950 [Candidatus Riflebacteria bacterium]